MTPRTRRGRIAWGVALGVWSLSRPPAMALETTAYVAPLNVQVQTSPPQITLSWSTISAVNYRLFRKLATDTAWGAPIVLTNTATTFTDTNVAPGVSYEYQMAALTTTYPYPNGDPSQWLTAYGYCSAGIEAPLIENRGKIILIVDDRFSAPLANELARLQADLVGDGWTVLRHEVNVSNSVTSVKALIQSDYNADPAHVRSVFLFGHVPVPYSGELNPDGHADHLGAWPADVFYADMNGAWPDSTVSNTTAEFDRNFNVPGDGKFDPSELPTDTELEIGRVDLCNLPAFTPLTELDLLRQYLDKDHNFRFGNLSVQRRGLVLDHFGALDGEAPAASAWRNYSALFGSNTTVAVGDGEFFTTLSSQSFLFAYGCGGGGYTKADGVGFTSDFATTDPRAVFTMLLGSYFGDWDTQDNFLRAPLATASYGLASAWAGLPHWYWHHLALGETLGFSARLTQNNATNGLYRHQVNASARGVHLALMGDHTLRLHPVRPASGLTNIFPGAPVLSWNPSPDAVLGYHVYRAANAAGPFTRLTTGLLTATNFTDTNAPAGANTYLVRAVKLETSGGGTYFNPSQGIFHTLNVIPGVNPCSPGPLGLSGWWPGDGNALDIQGTNHGAPMNGVAFTAGNVGQAFSFDGVNDFVSIGAQFAALSNNFTLMFWAWPQDQRTTTAEDVTSTSGSVGQRYAIRPAYLQTAYGANGAGWGVSLGTNGISVFEEAISHFSAVLVHDTPFSNWTHIAVVCSNRLPRLYLNGVLKRTGITSGSVCHPSADLGGPTGNYHGLLDEVTLHNRVLTGAEILTVANAGTAGLCKQIFFAGISHPTATQTLLTLEGRTGALEIQSSSNLLGWTQIGLVTNATGTVNYLDGNGGGQARRFYRAVVR
ncbi:MAG: hypothetical protein EXS35_13725 [Pedosphaera sp.]|nr:hypothetical protein [Pedosphaera sp.]